MLQGSGAMPTLVVEEGIVNFSNGKSAARRGPRAAEAPHRLPSSPRGRELPDTFRGLSRFNVLPGAQRCSGCSLRWGTRLPAFWDQA